MYSNFIIVCRILIGLIFIFSGFVKGVDPLGTTYKLIDYFTAFQIDFLNSLALTFSVLLNMSEFILGIALVFGVFTNFFSWIALVYMLLFTPLTLVLAIYNPVTDCGCFGDAIVMTNWQTFYKNIVITAILVPLFIWRKKIPASFHSNKQWIVLAVSALCFVFLSAYTYRHLPIVDFRPYKVGTYIPDGMKIPEGTPVDSFSYVFVYRKGEVLNEFSLENIPAEDTAWKWVETKTEMIRTGYHPPIHDFSFSNLQGENITDSILYDTSYTFLAISYKMDKASKTGLQKLKSVYEQSKEKNFKFYFATASTAEQITEFRDALSLPFAFYTADDIMLKTVVRSNPGLVLIKNGNIIDKWHYNDFPDMEKVTHIYSTVNLNPKEDKGRL